MKKIAVLGAPTLLVLGFSAPRANAQLFCFTTPGFCDRIEVEGIKDGVITGNYDFLCDDSFSGPMVGRIAGGHVTFSGPAFNPGSVYLSDLDFFARTEDFWEWDGAVLTQHLDDAPVSLTPGPCPPPVLGGSAGRSRVSAE